MDKIPVDVLCPICLHVPEGEGRQCGQGHLICSKCIANLQKRPQCLKPFEEPKSRTGVVESLLESYTVDCPHKNLGCDKKLLKDKLETHEHVCVYRGERMNICKEFNINCEALVNIQDVAAIIEHLKSHESNEMLAKPTTRGFILILPYNHDWCVHSWHPIIIHCRVQSFLVKVRYNIEDQLDISWLELSTDSITEKGAYQVEMIIRNAANKGREFKSTYPIPATMSGNKSLISGDFCVSSNLIRKNYTKNGTLITEFRIIKLPDNSTENSSTPPKRQRMAMRNCVIC